MIDQTNEIGVHVVPGCSHLGKQLLAYGGPPAVERLVHEVVLEELHAGEHIEDGLLPHPFAERRELAARRPFDLHHPGG